MTEEEKSYLVSLLRKDINRCENKIRKVHEKHGEKSDVSGLKARMDVACSLHDAIVDGSGEDFLWVGAWLLPEVYGDTYDHLTNTHMQTTDGQCIAVYAKRSDLERNGKLWAGR